MCGCTHFRPCERGCGWAELLGNVGLCTACAGKPDAAETLAIHLGKEVSPTMASKKKSEKKTAPKPKQKKRPAKNTAAPAGA